MTIPTRTNKQSLVLHAILAKLGINPEGKAQIVYEVSNERTSESSKLSFLEMKTLIDKLNELSKGHTPNPTQEGKFVPKTKEAESMQKMRRTILSCCYTMHWTDNDGVDYIALDKFLLEKGVVKKRLNELTHDELVKVVTQFKEMDKKEYK
jgi:hypothetical protein